MQSGDPCQHSSGRQVFRTLAGDLKALQVAFLGGLQTGYQQAEDMVRAVYQCRFGILGLHGMAQMAYIFKAQPVIQQHHHHAGGSCVDFARVHGWSTSMAHGPSMVLTGRAINGINQFIERVRVAVKQRINQFVLGGVVVIKVNWADAEFGGNPGGRGIAFAKLVEQFKRDIRKR